MSYTNIKDTVKKRIILFEKASFKCAVKNCKSSEFNDDNEIQFFECEHCNKHICEQHIQLTIKGLLCPECLNEQNDRTKIIRKNQKSFKEKLDGFTGK